jgi:hypothetical protein
MFMLGLNIVAHPLAREVRDVWKIERHPTWKRRRRWCVVKHHIDRPGAYQCGNTIYMHPELVAMLPRAVAPNDEVSRSPGATDL